MNIKELRTLNDNALKNLDTYKALNAQKCLSNYFKENGKDSIKYYYQAKKDSTTIDFYKQAFEINAIKLAIIIKEEIERTTGKNFYFDVVLDKSQQSEINDPFGNKFIEFYDYSLVLKEIANNDNVLQKIDTIEIIPVAKNKSSIVSSNKEHLVFDKEEALKSFERKTVNLIGNNPIYIRNYNYPQTCQIAKKYNLEDYLWQIVEQEIETKKEQKNEEIKENIKKLNEKKKAISSNDIDFLVK